MATRQRDTGPMVVTGMVELQEFFKTMPWKVAGNIQRKAVRAALTPIVKAYRRNLKGAVTATTGKALGRHTGILSRLQTTGKKVKGYKRSATVVGLVGPKARAAPHAHLVEYGTGPRRHKSGKSVGIMPPYAPLRKAFDSNLGKVKQIMRAKIKEGIDAEMKKLVRATRRAR